MKKFLISIIILGYGVTIVSFIFNRNNPLYQNWVKATWIIWIFIIILNALCARYLYGKATSRKTEWALFGFMGNIQAIFVYWIWNRAVNKWKQGEHFFSK